MKAYGSLQNRMMEDTKSLEPIVGMGCTEVMYSDRHAHIIVEVSPDKKSAFVVKAEGVKAPDYNYFGNQSYTEFKHDPNDKHRHEIKLCKDGRWRMVVSYWRDIKGHPEGGKWGKSAMKGNIILLGHCDEYQDPSF